jgi:hypothetical protein
VYTGRMLPTQNLHVKKRSIAHSAGLKSELPATEAANHAVVSQPAARYPGF